MGMVAWAEKKFLGWSFPFQERWGWNKRTDQRCEKQKRAICKVKKSMEMKLKWGWRKGHGYWFLIRHSAWWNTAINTPERELITATNPRHWTILPEINVSPPPHKNKTLFYGLHLTQWQSYTSSSKGDKIYSGATPHNPVSLT